MNRLMRFVVLPVLAGALLLAACGGGSSPLTKKEFTKQANQICRESQKKQIEEFSAFLQKGGKPKGSEAKEQEEIILTIAVPGLEEKIEGLKELSPPSGDEDEVEAIIEGLEEVLEEAKANPSTTSVSSSKSLAKVAKLATAYGIPTCTEGL